MGSLQKSSEDISQPQQCITFGIQDKVPHAEASSKESKSLEEKDKDKARHFQLNDVSSFTNSF